MALLHNSMDNYYVYAFLDPRTSGHYTYGEYTFSHEPFYIGKGSGSRIQAHFWTRNLRCKHPKNSKIKKLLFHGLYPVIVKLHESLSESQAFEKETQAIITVGRKDQQLGPLLNLYEGGHGSSKSEATRQKISKTKKKQYEAGLITHGMLGKHHSSEAKLKMSAAHKGTRWTQKQKDNLKKVRCKHKCKFTKWWLVTSPNNITTKVYGLGEFCRDNNLAQSKMFLVSTGKRNHHKGWKCQEFKG